MARCDRLGLALTTNAAAAAAYRHGTELLLSAWPGALDAFDAALAEDPEFALGHIARARVLQMQARLDEARAAAARARLLTGPATAREVSHIALLGGLVEGQASAVLDALPAHLDAWPADALVLSLALGAFGLYAFSGRADHDAARVTLCRRHAAAYAGDWWFAGYLGWSLTEAGGLAEGAEHTARALELRRANANAAHAMAHSLFERGGAWGEFITAWLPEYPRAGALHGHISWHLALAALEAGDTGRARALFEERLRPDIAECPAAQRLHRRRLAALAPRAGRRGGGDGAGRRIRRGAFRHPGPGLRRPACGAGRCAVRAPCGAGHAHRRHRRAACRGAVPGCGRLRRR